MNSNRACRDNSFRRVRLLFAKWLPAFVQLDSRLPSVAVLPDLVGKLKGHFLVLDGLVKIARPGTSGAECSMEIRRLPASQPTGLGRQLDRPCAVADLGLGAGGQ